MTPELQSAPVSKTRLWAGVVISALAVLMLLVTSSMALMKAAPAVQGFAHFGYPESVLVVVGVVELACAVIYAIPRTSVLGAILLTGYLGGAVATHVRIGESMFIMPLVLGVFVWLGLYLRDERLHALVPLRK